MYLRSRGDGAASKGMKYIPLTCSLVLKSIHAFWVGYATRSSANVLVLFYPLSLMEQSDWLFGRIRRVDSHYQPSLDDANQPPAVDPAAGRPGGHKSAPRLAMAPQSISAQQLPFLLATKTCSEGGRTPTIKDVLRIPHHASVFYFVWVSNILLVGRWRHGGERCCQRR